MGREGKCLGVANCFLVLGFGCFCNCHENSKIETHL